MNIKYRQLKAFILAARSLSFTESAAALSITQASFSNLMKELEADLGLLLFERTTRSCVLTDVGRSFYDNLSGSFEHIEDLYRQMTEVGQGLRGRLLISALPSMAIGFIPPVLADYRAAYPDVEIVLKERTNEDVFRLVRERKVELGLGIMLGPDETLDWIPLFSDRVMLIVPDGHELVGKKVGWRTLERFPHIMMVTGSTEYAMRVQNLRLKTISEVEHVATAVAMVRNGLGITTLPSSVMGALNFEGVTAIPITGKLTVRRLGVAYRKESRLTRVAECFVEMLRAKSSAGT